MAANKNNKTPEPRMNEQDLREKVKDSPAYEGARSQSDTDSERNRQDEEGSRHTRDKGHNAAAAEGRTDRNQTHDRGGEAQNVNDDAGRPLTDNEASQATNKATEGMRQGRDEGPASKNAEGMNNRS